MDYSNFHCVQRVSVFSNFLLIMTIQLLVTFIELVILVIIFLSFKISIVKKICYMSSLLYLSSPEFSILFFLCVFVFVCLDSFEHSNQNYLKIRIWLLYLKYVSGYYKLSRGYNCFLFSCLCFLYMLCLFTCLVLV